MKLYAIRHGETDYNKIRLVQGLMNNPLNETGKNQALMVGSYLNRNHYHFDHLYSTSLSRAYDTANIIKTSLNHPNNVLIHDGFIERDFGPFEGKKVDETIKIISVDGFSHDGYEDNDAMLKRIEDALNNLYQTHKDDSICLVCHSHTIKALLVLSDPTQYHFLTYLNNASMCVFDYDGITLKVDHYNIEMLEANEK